MKDLGIITGQPITQKLEIEEHATVISAAATSALDGIKSWSPVWEYLNNLSQKTTAWMADNGPRLWQNFKVAIVFSGDAIIRCLIPYIVWKTPTKQIA
jgi:hypothetical protein